MSGQVRPRYEYMEQASCDTCFMGHLDTESGVALFFTFDVRSVQNQVKRSNFEVATLFAIGNSFLWNKKTVKSMFQEHVTALLSSFLKKIIISRLSAVF